MIYDGKIFLTLPLATAAIALAVTNWTPPSYTDIGTGRHTPWGTLPAQVSTAPIQMDALTYAVIGFSFSGDVIDTDLFKKVDLGIGLVLSAQTQGAESGVVARPGATGTTPPNGITKVGT
jgi:hypothetical protein